MGRGRPGGNLLASSALLTRHDGSRVLQRPSRRSSLGKVQLLNAWERTVALPRNEAVQTSSGNVKKKITLESDPESRRMQGKPGHLVCGGDYPEDTAGHAALKTQPLRKRTLAELRSQSPGSRGAERHGVGMTGCPHHTLLPTVRDISIQQRTLQIRRTRQCDPLRTCRVAS